MFGDDSHDVTPVSERQQFPYGSAPNNGKAIIAPAFADYKGEGDSPGATKGIVYYKVSLPFEIKYKLNFFMNPLLYVKVKEHCLCDAVCN